jgi:ferrochelatase
VKTGRIAVVLFQLGGPDSADAVEPFLYNLFRDPDIIDFPGAFLARNALARFIASRRSGRVAENYRQIGGKSPILELTNAQAEALRAALAPHVKAEVFVAMRYWKPFTADAVKAVREGGFDRTFLLPLYPHYSKATTLSSLKEWQRESERAGLATERQESVCCFFNHPLFIQAIAENVTAALGKFEGVPPGDIDIVFSAHGVPVSLVNSGDPYKMQIEETVRLVAAAGGWTSPRTLCYQSKVGPMEWLKPSLNETVRALASAGRKNLLVVPVAFVTDHIETLHEINIEARREALHLGVSRFEMVPGLNSGATFISCLADIVLKGLRGSAARTETCLGVCARSPQAIAPSLCPHWKREGVLRR